MKETKIYSVGEMAETCGISPRQLRYYDQIGVIRPSYRNPENGYRYYSEDQIEPLLFLKELKQIGISNDSIQRLFINRDVDQLVQELQINLTMVEQEIQAAFARYHNIVNALVLNTRALAYLHGEEAILSSEYSQFRISIVKVPAVKILYLQFDEDLEYGDRNAYINHVVELTRLAESTKLKLADTKMFIRHANLRLRTGEESFEKKSTYEFAQEIVSENIPENLVNVKTFGGFQALCTVNVGALTSTPQAYEILPKWARDHNLAISDTSVEEYMVDALTSSDEDRFVTRITIPLLDNPGKKS
ncbi:MAG: MerR family transcriptional regulator [Eubacteriales bacterium]|nr:MerR family transcriptional regulator [Eubacteriales bacterium]